MSRVKTHPVYQAMIEGTGCGHQHKTPRQAYNCGGGHKPVYQIRRDRQGEVKYVKVIEAV